jgi:deoxyinosine 3'endonuclease (endonuclease V)
LSKLSKNFSVKNAHKTQVCISKLILKDKLPKKIRTICGVDVSYLGNISIGAITVLDYEPLEILEKQVATCVVKMPYIPSLLSLRGNPFCDSSYQKVEGST